MVTAPIKPENRLKAAVIDRLYASAAVDNDAVLISEMVVENWTRRADVVLANGRLWGFEVKSENDSLARLPGQIEAFRRAFEKLTIVTVPKFENAVRELIPDGVGLWVEGPDGSLKERARARIVDLSAEAAIRLMSASDLRALLQCNGVAGLSGLSRAQLEQQALGLPRNDLAIAARGAVKRKHRQKHKEFERRRSCGTVAALCELRSRADAARDLVPPRTDSLIPVEHVAVAREHPAFHLAPAGPVLRRMPR